MTPPLGHVREIVHPDDLADLRPLWDSLLSRTPEADFLRSLDWLTVYWKHYGAQHRLRVLVVSQAGQPVGILPLVLTREATHLGSLRVLTYPVHEWGPFYGPIGPYPAATLALGLAHVRCVPRDWDLIDLRWVHTAGWDRGRTEASMRAAGFAPQRRPWSRVALLDLSRGWDHYWATRNRRWRKNVRRCERRLGERGTISHIRYRPSGSSPGSNDPRWDIYYACERIASRSWQGAAENGNTLSHAGVQPFMRDAHAAAARVGAVDINLLLLNEVPVAFMYGYFWQGRVLGMRMGFDPSLATEGAGTVLLQKMVEDSSRRGDQLINLGSDYLACKRYWQTSIDTTQRCTYFAPGSFRGQAIRCKRWLESHVKSLTRAASCAASNGEKNDA